MPSEPATAPAQQQAPVPDLLQGLPLWNRRYILALAATGTELDARRITHVSAESVQTCIDNDPRFARAHDLALSGAYRVAPGVTDDEIAQIGPALVQDVARSAFEDTDTRKKAQALTSIMGARTQAQGGAQLTVQVVIPVQVLTQVQALSPQEQALALETLRAKHPRA